MTDRIATETIIIEIKPHCSIIELYPKNMKYIGKKTRIIDNSAIDIAILFLEYEFIVTQQLASLYGIWMISVSVITNPNA